MQFRTIFRHVSSVRPPRFRPRPYCAPPRFLAPPLTTRPPRFSDLETCLSNIFWFLRNPIWSSLIKSDPFWTDLIQKKIKNKTVIFILSVNMTSFHWKIYKLVRKSNLIKFDHVWSILDRSDPQKSKTKYQCLSFP